jgi:hypothetical protein
MLSTAFWQRAAQSLSQPVRQRYAAQLERGERIDLFMEAVVEGWGHLCRALSGGVPRAKP